MGRLGRLLAALVATSIAVIAAEAQDPAGARGDYFQAVAAFFHVPASEVAILADWGIADDEVSAILFIATRAGVSPEALVALRSSGQGLSSLGERYRIGASALHLPLRDQADTGTLSAAYGRYRSTPVGDWASIRLTDADIVALVNVRVIADALGLAVEDVIRQTSPTRSFVDLFAALGR